MKERQYRQGLVRAIPEGESRTVEFTVSDESKDRHGTIIPTRAWNLESFKGNPVAGWAHKVYGGDDPDNYIGTWEIWQEEKELAGALTFEDKETNPLADKLLRKVRNGTINAVSVGFLPDGGHKGDEEKGEDPQTYYYDSVELVEVSLVGIPSNKNARKKAIEDTPELIEELVRDALGDEFNEKITLKGLFQMLRGGDAVEIEQADTGKEVDPEAREVHAKRLEAWNKYIEFSK